ncbi:ABC transporter permease [Halomonas sp. QHL1]|uniref:ABC transporter permease n=1 Tax=Halomonas sp. QHL1 TaxID=1123773 RepID=UPI0008FD0369|nr:FtsX-like permease family protein [Halomonas sp. QHL1]OJA05842.1 ABC transporter permease [Halomonas sp. QHL1]
MNLALKRLRLLVSLALQDLWHDRKVSMCIAAALIAVIAPLLLLFGLKYGVVSQLQSELLEDPRNVEIRMVSSGRYDAAWIERLRSRRDVGFAIGMTRSLNTQADLVADHRHFVDNTEVIPTAEGDPLLASLSLTKPLNGSTVVLSESAARRLNAVVNDQLSLFVSRRLDGRAERGRQSITVAGILPPEVFPRPAAFVALPLLIELEDFRDGYRIDSLGVSTGEVRGEMETHFARARLYAADIDRVAELEQWLNAQHIDTTSRLAEIENVKAINHVLGLVFGVIASTALVGCLASMLGAFLANIDRKRKDLAVLRLLGFDRPAIAGYIVLQAGTLTLAAYVVGLGLYGLGSQVFNQALASSATTGSVVCRLTFMHGVIALLLALLVALMVAVIGVLRAFSIEPAESLREL